MTDPNQKQSDDHWLVRPTTIRNIWIAGICVLLLTLLAGFFIPTKGYFGIDDWPGFGAVFGFLCCLLMVLFAKALGFVLKRDEDYYGADDRD
ncbi:MAG: hypothetical protein P8N51_03555 [Pseudomonadales bacterium]|nr:hypothetical protein [Pseudomonadales bacterium]MDG1443020.1 hypothetical protein [Pseudomonadales bacterium]